MANMDNIIKRQEDERYKGVEQLRSERDRYRTNLRDKFAMAALTAAITINEGKFSRDDIADLCYLQADAMLKARGE